LKHWPILIIFGMLHQ